jgi:hypothetical protein
LPEEGSASEQSLATRGLLQRHRAALCQLQIAEKQKELIPSGPVVEFLAAVLKVMYHTIRAFPDLSTQGQDELCETIRQHVTAHWVRAGWSLTPIEQAQRSPPRRSGWRRKARAALEIMFYADRYGVDA